MGILYLIYPHFWGSQLERKQGFGVVHSKPREVKPIVNIFWSQNGILHYFLTHSNDNDLHSLACSSDK